MIPSLLIVWADRRAARRTKLELLEQNALRLAGRIRPVIGWLLLFVMVVLLGILVMAIPDQGLLIRGDL